MSAAVSCMLGTVGGDTQVPSAASGSVWNPSLIVGSAQGIGAGGVSSSPCTSAVPEIIQVPGAKKEKLTQHKSGRGGEKGRGSEGAGVVS